jgi:hypothetical protein
MARVLLQVDYPHVLHVMEARLIQEGFIQDTPDRRRLARLMAGPQPAITKNEMEESTCSTH